MIKNIQLNVYKPNGEDWIAIVFLCELYRDKWGRISMLFYHVVKYAEGFLSFIDSLSTISNSALNGLKYIDNFHKPLLNSVALRPYL